MSRPLTPTTQETEELVATRRDIHQHPELKYAEERTAGIVADRLRALGYGPETGVGRTGVVAVLDGAEPGPCVLLRADMDALPLQELSDVPYRSTIPNVMHACGHDGHTAMALAAARILKREAPSRGRVKLMFQPAEEGGNGAVAMIEDGVLEDPKVDAAFAIHLWSGLETGKVYVTPGPVMASVDEFKIRIQGRGGHGAVPHESRDPVLAAAHVVTALQQIAARNVSPLQGAVVTVGSIHGGHAFNIIPDEVELAGTMRCYDDEVWDALPGHLERVVTHAAKSCGCTAEVELERMMRATVNDPQMAELTREVAAELVGPENVSAERLMAGEDFAEILARVPGCYFLVGARNESRGIVHPHHSPYFDIDEAALPLGAELLSAVAHRYLEG